MAMARLFALALSALCACYSTPNEQSCTVRCATDGACPGDFACRANNLCGAPDDLCNGRPVDAAPIDSSVNDAGEICYGHGVAPFLSVCPPLTASSLLTIAAGTLSTTSGCTMTVMQQAPGSPMVCVIAARTIRISGHVTVVGDLPLLLLAREGLTIDASAVLDVAAHVGSTVIPAGSLAPGCVPGDGGTNVTGPTGGGGAGGSFGGAGGPAGAGGNGAAAAGTPQAAQPAIVLRGGCRGGSGGTADGGKGGIGGGAVYLMAGTEISVDGTINASGSGGQLAMMRAGGGGGGSGGMIVIDAPQISISGSAFALGGGGASGGAAMASGNPGNDPTGVMGYAAMSAPPPSPAGIGGGGGIPSNGMQGDLGGAGSGGGGGGGGGGVIRIWPTASVLTTVDPPAF